MNKSAFLVRLREGLRGLHPAVIDDVVRDYESHFADGLEAGRTEDEISAALGDPGRLARELRAEIGLKRWEEDRSPSAAAGAVFAVLGLGAIDLLVLLPVLLGVVSAIFGLYIAAICVFFSGGGVLAVGPFSPIPGAPWSAVLGGIGLMAGSVSVFAVLTLITIGLVNVLVWYGRLHFKLLKPAIEPQG